MIVGLMGIESTGKEITPTTLILENKEDTGFIDYIIGALALPRDGS